MADYNLQYQDTYIDALLATANELKTAGYIYKGVATPSTNPGTPTERVAYLASEPGTYTNFGNLAVTGLSVLTYNGSAWDATNLQLPIDIVQATGQSTTSVMSQKAVTDLILPLKEKNVFAYDTTIGNKSNSYMTISLADQVYTITRVKAGGLYYTYIMLPTTLVVGKTYKLRFDWANGATIAMVCGLTTTLLTSDSGWLNRYSMAASSSGSAEIEFTYSTAYVYLEFWNGTGTSNNKTITISNLQIIEDVVFVDKGEFDELTDKLDERIELIENDIYVNEFDWNTAVIGRTNAAYTISKGTNIGDYIIHCTTNTPTFYYIYITLPSLVANKKYQIKFRVKSTSLAANTIRIRQETTSANLYTQTFAAGYDGWVTLNYTYNNSGGGASTSLLVMDGSGMTNGSYLYITDFQVGYDRIDRLWDASDENESYLIKIKKLFSLPNGKFTAISPQLKDVYVDLVGDSIFAFQWSTPVKIFASDGVTRVPATCDLQAVAYMLWNYIKWGNVNYRRFDDGKASLVSAYDDRWADDSEAFFVETGVFYTQYVRDALSPVTAVVTTALSSGHFSSPFDESETQSSPQQQRNIPKRFSNDANASIQFTIPSGYGKFDFVYHAHILGDNVTISISRGNGIVKYNTKPNDWANAIEANDASIDLSLTPCLTGSGDDTYGIPNKRIHFQISNTSADTIVTITKSADTSKYLIYWGVEYWGTTSYPYALHIDNMAVGGFKEDQMYGLRGSMIKAVNPTSVIMEVSMNTLYSLGYDTAVTQLDTYLSNYATYLDGYDVAAWIPHEPVLVLSNPNRMLSYTAAEQLLEKNNFPCLFSMARVIATMVEIFYPDITLTEFMNSLGNSGLHLNNTGHMLYRGAWESVL